MAERKLGDNQRVCLPTLHRLGSWPGGWIWIDETATRRILDSLGRRGLVKTRRGIYYPTKEKP